MKLLFDSLWRAIAYGFRPEVILRTLVPLLLGVVVVTALCHWCWDAAVDQARYWVDVFPYTQPMLEWMGGGGAMQLRPVLAPLVLAVACTPLMVLLALLAVVQFLTPALARLVAGRRFTVLQAMQARAFLMTFLWCCGSCLMALVALMVSFPLWVIPPLWLVLPPLILGWLAQRVLVFAALVRHASREERILVSHAHRLTLFFMGVTCAYLTIAPGVLWVWMGGPRFASAFVILAPLAVALYTLLLAFSSLWFTHFCLAALRHIRTTMIGRAGPKETP